MNAQQICAECGAAIPAGAGDSRCPACLLKLALGAPASLPARSPVEEDAGREAGAPSLDTIRSFGDYELLEEIARGGMGVVYKARQVSLNRTVAVKMLLSGQFASKEFVQRFRAEAQAVAHLQHPNIVAIHEVVEHNGQNYFSMDYVEGQNLAELIRKSPIPFKRAAQYVLTIAKAIHYAHQNGLLHRDLKPSNVLIDAADQPRITDFGLARRLTGDSDLTATGQVLGSPNYMPPEQAGAPNGEVGPPSDVYSLGAILYHLLTTRPPFVAETIQETLFQVVHQEPVLPRLLDPRIPRDLETLCLKCLDKDPRRRYASADQLADDLNRFLRDEPVRARPIPTAARFWRWCRRRRALAATAGALAVTVVAGTIALSLELYRSQRSERRALSSLREALMSDARSQRESGRAGQRFQTLKTLQQAAAIRLDAEVRNEMAAALAKPDLQFERKWTVRQRSVFDRVGFSSDLKLYAEDSPNSGFDLRSSRDRQVVRHFPRADKRNLVRAIFSSDSKWIAALYSDGSVEIWNVAENTPRLSFAGGGRLPAPAGFRTYTPADFHPSGDSVALSPLGTGLVLQSLTGENKRVLDAEATGALFIRFDPSGRRLAVQRWAAVELWEVTPGRKLWSADLEMSGPPGIAWSPDGELMAVVSVRSPDVLLLEAASGRVVRRLAGNERSPLAWEFHPGGQWLATASRDELRLWDVHSGRQLLQMEADAMVLQFSRDGSKLIASPEHQTVAQYELASGEIFGPWQSPGETFHAQALGRSANDRFLVTAGFTNLCVWDDRVKAPVGHALLPEGAATHVFFGADDKEIIYSMGGNVFRRDFSWSDQNDPGNVQLGAERLVGSGVLFSVGFDGRSWLVLRRSLIELWPDGQPERGRVVVTKPNLDGAAISPDARWVVPVDFPGRELTVWDAATGRPRKTFKGQFGRAWFSPDGQWLVGCSPAGVHFWEVGTWKPGPVLPTQLVSGAYGCLAFAQKGHRVALLDKNDSLRILRLPEFSEVARLRPPFRLDTRCLELSEDGSRLWILGGGHRIFEWNLERLDAELKRLLTPGSSPDERHPAPEQKETVLNVAPKRRSPGTINTGPAAVQNQGRANNVLEAANPWSARIGPLMRQQKYAEVENVFAGVLTPEFVKERQSVSVLMGRAGFFVRQERWADAIADVSKAVELDSANDTNRFTLALLLARNGDTDGYGKLRRTLLDRFSSTADGALARRVSKACLLLPARDPDLATACRMAAMEQPRGLSRTLCMALAEYRQGRHTNAMVWANKVLAKAKSPLMAAQSGMVVAMACQQLGQRAEVRSALQEGVKLFEIHGRGPFDFGLESQWGWGTDEGEWLMAGVLMNEARALIEGPKAPTGKSSH